MLQAKLKSKDIDLLSAYKKKKEPSKYSSVLKMALIPTLMAVLLLLSYGILTFQNYRLDKDIKDTKAEIAAVKKKIEENPQLDQVNSLNALSAKTYKYTTLYKNLTSYPQLTQAVFDQLLIASGVNVDITAFSYTRDSQVITLQIEAPDANDAEQFVRRVKSTGVFQTVNYSGYSRVEKSETSAAGGSEAAKTDSDEKDSDLQALIDAISKNKESQDNVTTRAVYTATVLCTLK